MYIFIYTGIFSREIHQMRRDVTQKKTEVFVKIKPQRVS